MATLGMMLAVLLALGSGLVSSQTQNSCTSPIPFANGKVIGYDTLYGSTLRFTCNDGYLLQGSDFSLCGGPCNGSVCTWVPALPHCQAIFCPRLVSYGGFWLINGGTFRPYYTSPDGTERLNIGNEYRQVRHNGHARYWCNLGYHISNLPQTTSTLNITCSPSGRWDPPPPTCRDIDECSATTHSCHPNANCRNRDGSYTCTCADGFVGRGEHCNAQLRLPGDQAIDILVLDKNTTSSPWTLKKLHSNISPGDSEPFSENKENKAYAFVMYQHGVAKGLQNVVFQEHNSSASEWAQQAVNVTRVMDFNTTDGTATIHFRSLPWPTEDGVWMEYRNFSLTCYAEEQPQSQCDWTAAPVTNRYLPVTFSSGLSYEYRLYVVRGTESNGNKSNSTDAQRRRRSVDESTREYTVPLSFATNHHSDSAASSGSTYVYAGIGGGLAILACLGIAAFVIIKLRSRIINSRRQALDLKTSSQTTPSVASMTENAAYGTHLPQADCTQSTTYCTLSEVESGAPNHITVYEEVAEIQDRQPGVLEGQGDNDYELMDCAV